MVKKNTVLYILLLLLLGAGTLVYPRIQHRLFHRRAQAVIMEFEEYILAQRLSHRATRNNTDYVPIEEDQTFVLNMIGGWLKSFNYSLYHNGQEHLMDPFAYLHPSFSLQPFGGMDIDTIGILNVSSIDLSMPILLGASHENLHRGVAHLTHSSFPVGGTHSNTVIAGHRNLAHVNAFRDLGKVQVGDEVQIINFHQVLTYVVVYTGTVNSYETGALAIQSGRDLVTLVTLHETWRGRSGRYLVVAERVL